MKKRNYRIIKDCDVTNNGDVANVIKIQLSRLHGLFWTTIWSRAYNAPEEEYALGCAKEIVDHLNETI